MAFDPKTHLRCPIDAGRLHWDEAGITCLNCDRTWPRHGDIPVFGPTLEVPENDAAPAGLRAAPAGRNDWRFLLPSGENVARELGQSEADIAKVTAAACEMDPAFAVGTPLWLYCLLEGGVLGRGGVAKDKGEGLGPVGGRIVAEVIIGLLECDDRSWLAGNRSWTPQAHRATVVDLLASGTP